MKTFLIEDFFSFATGVSDTGGQPWAANISATFGKKFEKVLMGHSGAGGKLIHKKTRSKKSRDTVPLILVFQDLNFFTVVF